MKLLEIKNFNDWRGLIFANSDKVLGTTAVMVHIGDDEMTVVAEDIGYSLFDGNLQMRVPDDFDSDDKYRHAAYIIARAGGSQWLCEHLNAMYYPIEPVTWYPVAGRDRVVHLDPVHWSGASGNKPSQDYP